MQGDCLERMKEIPDGSIDLILTDPPYGMSYNSGRRKVSYGEIKNDHSLYWLDGFAEECFRVANNNTAHYVTCSFHHISHTSVTACLTSVCSKNHQVTPFSIGK